MAVTAIGVVLVLVYPAIAIAVLVGALQARC
jgi:hypothetical protein